MVAITTVAIRGGQLVLKPPDSRNCTRPSGSVQCDWLRRKISGQKKLFQVPWNVQDADRRERRRGERQQDAPERREEAGAVQLGGFLQLDRQRQEVLPHQEDAGRRDRQDQRSTLDVLQLVLEQPEVGEQHEDRHQPQLVRDHQRREHDQEQQLAAREPQAREGIAAQAAQREVGERDCARR